MVRSPRRAQRTRPPRSPLRGLPPPPTPSEAGAAAAGSCARSLRFPVPSELVSLVELGLEIGAPPQDRFWHAVEARAEAFVLSVIPPDAPRWNVALDAPSLEIVVELRGRSNLS